MKSLIGSLPFFFSLLASANTMSIDTGIEAQFNPQVPGDPAVSQFQSDCDSRIAEISQAVQSHGVKVNEVVYQNIPACPPRHLGCGPTIGYLGCTANLTSTQGSLSITTVKIKAAECDSSLYPAADAHTIFQNGYVDGSFFSGDYCVVDTIDLNP